MDIRDTNRRVIEQFRSGGPVEGMNREGLVLITTTGRVMRPSAHDTDDVHRRPRTCRGHCLERRRS